MKIEFGGGEKPKSGFKSCDVRKLPNVDYVCNAWEITNFVNADSVDMIYSRHFFEHLTYIEVNWTLDAWKNILTNNGTLIIIVPDMLFHIQQWLNPNRKKINDPKKMCDEEWAIKSIWGHQRETEKGEIWDVHKSGYDFELLKDKLEEFGFKNISRIKDKPKNLHVQAKKYD